MNNKNFVKIFRPAHASWMHAKMFTGGMYKPVDIDAYLARVYVDISITCLSEVLPVV